MSTVLMVIGVVGLLATLIAYYLDCAAHGGSLGGEMSFSGYWTISGLVLLAGACQSAGWAIWWCLPGLILFYLLSIPTRRLIRRVAAS